MKKRSIVIIILIVTMFIIITTFIYLYFSPYIKLNGKKTVILNVFDTYKEKGIKIIDIGKKDIVLIENNINNKKLGIYKVKYNYKGKTIERTINVIDNIPPVISIKGDNPKTICSYEKYVEDGINVSDNYDKDDIKVNVKIDKENKKVIYEAVDKSLNKTKVERNLIVDDKTPPVINVLNNDKAYLGVNYKDNYTAIDNCDGDITDKVIKVGNVDTNKKGIYEIKYEVSDSKNNKTTKVKQVEVIDKQGTIYLTFDDGPSYDITPKVLDILKKYNIKATFFVIGRENLDNIIKRAYDEGHTIGLHSYTHNYSIYKSSKTYFDDLNKISDKVYNITKEKPYIIRFPGGSSNTISKNYNIGIMSYLTDEVKRRGYHYFDWNVGSSDTASNDGNKICNNVKKRLGKGENVVLMHDYSGKTSSITSLECIIDYGLNNGYEFSKITKDTKEVHHYVAN